MEHTRSKNQLFIPIANLTSVQKGITYSGIIYNSLPGNILNLKNDTKQFKNELYRYVLYSSVYSVKEFLEFSRDNYYIIPVVICIVLFYYIMHSI